MALRLDESLVEVSLVGMASLRASTRRTAFESDTIPCAVVSANGQAALFLPNPVLGPLQAAYKQEIISKRQLYLNNMQLVNRDNGLFDNLPYASWTVDSDLLYRDAANNTIDPKHHLGKRDAFNRMMGKDWVFTVKQRADGDKTTDTEAVADDKVLLRRILEVRARDMDLQLADINSQLCIATEDSEKDLLSQQSELMEAIETVRVQLSIFDKASKQKDMSTIEKLWKAVMPISKTKAPYPGAMQYPALQESEYEGSKTFFSPYGMMKQIIKDQLKAEVIGAVLENVSILDDTQIVVGGALVLQRTSAKQCVQILGEKVQIANDDEQYGTTISSGALYVVSCFADEAIGMSLDCSVPLHVEQSVWTRGSSTAQLVTQNATLPLWKPRDPELCLLEEGESVDNAASERVAPLRISRSTSMFDDIMRPNAEKNYSSYLFPTDNPVASLQEYDELSSQDKARLLANMNSFKSTSFPRRRELRDNPDLLDDLLVPLVDETVRRQYLMRKAEESGDMEAFVELQQSMSARQRAIEQAELARQLGNSDEAERWQAEADFLETLRADSSQDEGSYSRFLDRDEWYERDRQNQAKRIDKSSFGTLLDGIE